MRISSSSSFLLATLAISSSSSSLAAPTEPGSLEPSTFASSSSIHSLAMAGRDDAFSVDFGGSNHRSEANSYPNAEFHMTHDRRQLESILPLLEDLPVVGDVLGPLIKKLLGMLGLTQNGPVSSEAISSLVPPTSAQISEIAQLLSAASSHLQGAAGQVAGGAASVVAGTAPTARRRALWMAEVETAGNSTTAQYSSVSATESATSLEAMAVPTLPAGAPGLPVAVPFGNNGTTPVSPPLPVNPPNSPVPTSGLPRPPVPAGASAPSGPIPRDAPPMFPAFKAADVSTASTSASASGSASMSCVLAPASASGSAACSSASGEALETASSSSAVATSSSTATMTESAATSSSTSA